MKKIGIVFLIAALIFVSGCSLMFGRQNKEQDRSNFLEKFGRGTQEPSFAPTQPSASNDAYTGLEDIPFSVIDQYDYLNDQHSVFEKLDYDTEYFVKYPDTNILEKYKGTGRTAFPFVNSVTEFSASVYSDHSVVCKYYVFTDDATLDDKLMLYNALCQTVADQYGEHNEGFYYYYYSDGKDRIEDLNFDDETIKTILAAASDDQYEFSRAWDPLANDMRLVMCFAPMSSAALGHLNGDIAIFIYSYGETALPTPTPKPASVPTPKPVSTPTPAPQTLISGTYYPLEGGNPFLTINGTNLTIDFGDDNVWNETISISGNRASFSGHGKFGDATFEQIDSEHIVVQNNYFGGTYTLN